MTRTEFRDALGDRSDKRITAAGIRRLIYGHPAFHRVPGDRYQIGASIES